MKEFLRLHEIKCIMQIMVKKQEKKSSNVFENKQKNV